MFAGHFILELLVWIGLVGLTVQAGIGLSFFISSSYEKEKRAAVFGFFQFALMLILLLGFGLLSWSGFFIGGWGRFLLIAGFFTATGAAFFLVRKTEPNPRALEGSRGLITGEVKRFDERAQVFARNRSIRPGSAEYASFYERHPEYETGDAERRKKGGPVGKPGTIDRPHGDALVAMTLAGQKMCEHLSVPAIYQPEPHPALKEKVSDDPVELTPAEATQRVKGYAKHIGASLVGITEINPLWIYSHRGEIFHQNWEDWGKEISIDFKYAIVMAEEMDLALIGPAPHTPTVLESMQVYAKGAYMTTQLAAFIANLGYGAVANHMRHYDAILPALAVDAGLGEMGRLGYVMTRELGPRMRLCAVLTNLPLVPDQPVDIGAEDFCRICKKCAVCCPSQSIPQDEEPAEHNGTRRWKLDAESCFNYWGTVGTDCNVCMRVCPWSHARTFPHRLIVWLITRNRHARRLFLKMDDIFYGRKPRPRPAPGWARIH